MTLSNILTAACTAALLIGAGLGYAPQAMASECLLDINNDDTPDAGDGTSNATATALDSLACGENSNAGEDSVAFGDGAVATTNAVAVGERSSALNDGVAVGQRSSSGTEAVAVGNRALAANDAVAIGSFTTAEGVGAVSIGRLTRAGGASAVAIGRLSNARHADSVAIGSSSSSMFDGAAAGAAYAGTTVGNVVFTEGTDTTRGDANFGNRILTGVTDGRIADASSDAVNGHQLFQATTNLDGRITTNAAAIATNGTAITANMAAIDTNVTNIAANTTSLTTNANNIATNATGVAANTAGITTNAAAITTNGTAITANMSAIDTNATNITANTTSLTTNANNIATNATGVAANVASITTNATNIATAVTTVETFDTRISANTTTVGTFDARITEANTRSSAAEAATTVNTDMIGVNVGNITQNRQAIADLGTNVGQNTTQILENSRKIDGFAGQVEAFGAALAVNTREISQNSGGIAVAMSMAGGTTLSPGSKLGFGANWATFGSEHGASFTAAARVTPKLQLNAGIGFTDKSGTTGARAGMWYEW